MRTLNVPPTSWGDYRLDWDAGTLVMGIVNVTPDSFSGDGLAVGADPAAWAEHAAAQAARMAREGARIIDVGGASSRPGAAEITAATEIARVVPAIRAIRAALPATVPIAIDAYREPVARAALDAGAAIINDIHGLRADPALADLAAARGVPLALMANLRGVPRRDVVSDILRQLAGSLDRALAAGVAWERLIVDPGFGFGLTPEENLTVLRRLADLTALGRPLLLGVSRKATLGQVLGGAPPAARLEASLAAAVVGALRGAAVIRAHDVGPTVRALALADAAR